MTQFKKLLWKTKTGQFLKFFDERDSNFEENFQKLQRLWFDFPSISNSIEYQDLWPEAQEDEWLYVTLSDEYKQQFLGEFLQLADTTDAYNLVNEDNYKKLTTVFLIYGNKILFSCIEPRFLIKNKTRFVFDEIVTLKEEENSVLFEWKIFAYFDWSTKIFLETLVMLAGFFDKSLQKYLKQWLLTRKLESF